MSTVILLMVGVLLIYTAVGSDLLEYILGRPPQQQQAQAGHQ